MALVMTLFVVALVTVLVLEYHFDASVEIDLATNYASDVQAYHLALAGVRFAQALLQQAPLNAPGMKFVVPGNVGGSFLAYKISGADELACVSSMCVAGASIGKSMPCGDPMPVGGILTAADRTKILDWIAQGAAD